MWWVWACGRCGGRVRVDMLREQPVSTFTRGDVMPVFRIAEAVCGRKYESYSVSKPLLPLHNAFRVIGEEQSRPPSCCAIK